MLPISTRRAIAIALASTSLLAVPAVASADVTATSDGTTITVTGTDAAEQIDITYYEGRISFGGPVTAPAGGGCDTDENNGGVSCAGVPGGVTVNMGGGDDRVHSYLTDAPTQPYGRYDLGAGN